ncbi:type II toxin-antitoxin system antitoxin DNA ADP-ribosyl glycohydrolase DarG [Thiomicrolovo sp. ZZH C-3]
MLTLMTGNILESDAECLVNTVNCEGFMGKGLAYQFKNMFPETNKSYINACKHNKLHPGELHYYDENGKLIINFPTKDKWREKSKLKYIDDGMKALVELINEKDIQSIAIPPLGSGNGGLNWEEVKKIIIKYIFPLSTNKEFFIYEPSLSYKAEIKKAPKLTMSHLILMNIKKELTSFSKFRLQKTAFFINLFSHQNYFKFDPHHYGPYSHSIEILSRDIKEFQQYHKFTTDKALNYAQQTLTSKKLEKDLVNFSYAIDKATKLVNSYASNAEIELLSTISFVVMNNPNINEKDIVKKVHEWSDLKKKKFSEKEILAKINNLVDMDILQKNILGEYCIKA